MAAATPPAVGNRPVLPSYTRLMARRRLRFRPPMVRPGSKIGPLGPFRGRLGLHWVIGSIVVAAVLGVAGWFLLAPRQPEPPWVAVGEAERFTEGSAVRLAAPPRVWVANDRGTIVALLEAPGCTATFCPTGHLAACNVLYTLDGLAGEGPGVGLDALPVRIHRGTVYVNPRAPIDRMPPDEGDPDAVVECPAGV